MTRHFYTHTVVTDIVSVLYCSVFSVYVVGEISFGSHSYVIYEFAHIFRHPHTCTVSKWIKCVVVLQSQNIWRNICIPKLKSFRLTLHHPGTIYFLWTASITCKVYHWYKCKRMRNVPLVMHKLQCKRVRRCLNPKWMQKNVTAM